MVNYGQSFIIFIDEIKRGAMSEVGLNEFGVNFNDFFAIGDHSTIIFFKNKSEKSNFI